MLRVACTGRDFVNVGCSFHIFCFLGEEERVDRFLVVLDGLSHSTNNGSLRIAAESRLQDPRELRVAVVDELFRPAFTLLTQPIDNVAQRQQ